MLTDPLSQGILADGADGSHWTTVDDEGWVMWEWRGGKGQVVFDVYL